MVGEFGVVLASAVVLTRLPLRAMGVRSRAA
jgi:hypothetical protein